MNTAPGWATWLELFAVLALGAAIIILFAALAERLFGRALWKRAIWQLCLLGLATLLMTELTGLTSGIVAYVRWPAVIPVVVIESPSAELKPKSHAIPEEPRGRSPAIAEKPVVPPAEKSLPKPALKEKTARVNPPKSERPSPVVREAPSVVLSQVAVKPPGSESQATMRPANGVWWPGLLWLLGGVIIAGRTILSRFLLMLFRRRLLKRQPPASDELRQRIQTLAQRLGIRRRITVIHSPALLSPAAFGILRPTIALPANFNENFDVAKQDVMIAHELAHLSGRDPAWQLLADLVAAGLWWHPLVWWSRRQLLAANEAVADEASLLVPDGPDLLAACLVELGQKLTQPRRVGWLRVEGNGYRSGLGRRVQRLVNLRPRDWQRPSRVRFTLAISCGLAAILAAAIFTTAWARPQAHSEGDLPMKTMKSSWQRSLAGIMMAAVLGSGAEPTPAEEPSKPKKEQPNLEPRVIKIDKLTFAKDDEPAKGTLRIKVFRLKHMEPKAVQEVLYALLGMRDRAASPPGMMPGVPGAPPGGPGRPMVAKTPQSRGAFRGYADGETRLNPMATTTWTVELPSWKVLVDEHSKSLIVRGKREHLELAADLVSLLDVLPNQPPPRVKNLQLIEMAQDEVTPLTTVIAMKSIDARLVFVPKSTKVVVAASEEAFGQVEQIRKAMVETPAKSDQAEIKGFRIIKLKHADLKKVVEVLSALEFNAEIVPVEKSKSIWATGSDEALKLIAEVVQMLDVDGKMDTKAAIEKGVIYLKTKQAEEQNKDAFKVVTTRPAKDGNPMGMMFGEGPAPSAAKLKTQVFRLKHRRPDEMATLLSGSGIISNRPTGLLEWPPFKSPPSAGSSRMGGGMGGMGMGGIGGAGFGGGFAGTGMAYNTGAHHPHGGKAARWRLSVNEIPPSIIVRGTDEDLQIAADLVTLLDIPKATPLPQVKSLRAFTLKFASADLVVHTVMNLELGVRAMAVSDLHANEEIKNKVGAEPRALTEKEEETLRTKLLVAIGPEEAMKELAAVIAELDVKGVDEETLINKINALKQ